MVAILQMTRTRRGAGGEDAGGSGSYGNGNEDLPPPPHPTPAEMMAQLLETQRSMGEVLCGLARMPAMDGEGTNAKGLNLISSAILRTFLTPNLLSLKKQRSHCRQMNG